MSDQIVVPGGLSRMEQSCRVSGGERSCPPRKGLAEWSSRLWAKGGPCFKKGAKHCGGLT